MGTKQDRRVRYSKMVLKESLIELMKKKSISKISISELCRFADINRNTFYNHYGTIEEVLNEVHEDVVERITESVDLSLPVGAFLVNLFREMDLIRDTLRVLYSDTSNVLFMERLIIFSKEHHMRIWGMLSSNIEEDMIEKIFIYNQHGILAIIEKWVKGEINGSPEEMAGFIKSMSEMVIEHIHLINQIK